MSDRAALPLPPNLEAKLAAFRRRVWMVKLAEGVLAAAFGLLLSWMVVFVLDRCMETPAWVRGGALLGGALVLGLGLPLKWHNWVWKQRRLEDAAKLLRKSFPRLGDQLLGIVELAKMGAGDGRSERLVQAAMAQADEAVKDADFTHAVPDARHQRWGMAVGAIGVLGLAAFVLVPAAAWNALARWVMPWAEVERYTFAKIEPLPEQRVVPYAESFDLKAVLRQDTEWSPEAGKVSISGQPVLESKQAEKAYGFSVPPQKEQVPLNLSVGDIRKRVDIIPMPRPEMKTLHAVLSLPTYLGYASAVRTEVRGGSVSVVEGASASYELTASRALATATLDGQAAVVKGESLITASRLVSESGEHEFSWKAADGLEAKEPLKLKVQMVKDAQPNVLARRETQEQVLLEDETLTLELDASDDFGVQKAGLLWRTLKEDGSTAGSGESVAVAGGNEKKAINSKATFNAKRDGVQPGMVELRGWVQDYFPSRERSVSPSFVIHVLSKDDHALWMTDMFGKWLQAARETHEQEERLHEGNKELRELTEAELDRPENRRRVAQQATAEDANKERLDALNDAGKKLIEQAARNDQFDAARLETWATMLRQLKDIASQRMPSVAEMLRKSANSASRAQTAQAPGQQQQQQNSAQQPSKPGETPKPGGESKSSPTAPKVAQGEQSGGEPKAPSKQDPNAPQVPKAPSLSDNEKSYLAKGEQPKQEEPGAPKKPSSGKLALPQTTLGAAPAKPGDKPAAPPKAEPDSPARQDLDKALEEQKKLLASFAKVTDQLQQLLASLEGSTFVKRLKSASKKQMAIAQSLNSSTLSAFGLDKASVAAPEAKASEEVSTRQQEQSSVVRVIQSDMEAYYQRKQDQRFKNLVEQMKKTEVVSALARIGDEAKGNFSGRGIAASEFWADVLDRWAEEMVAASDCSNCKGGSQDSLPPEIVLKVMQVLHDEMKLRDETREAEAARSAWDNKQTYERTTRLALRQDDIGRRTYEAMAEISKLPNAKSFGKEMQLLDAVTGVMKDAYDLLDKKQTDAPVVAAETEAIELLLQTKRQPPNGGGGGGGSDPGGSNASGSATSAALADIGPGSDMRANPEKRQIGQSTGKAGKEAPEEFKSGLDAYFNALEKAGGQ